MSGTPRHRESADAPTYETWRTSQFSNATKGTCTVSPSALVEYAGTVLTGSSMLSEQEQAMDDVVTPHFEKLRSQGKIINNPMTKSFSRYDSSKFQFSIEYYLDKYGCTPPRYYPYTDWKYAGTLPVSTLTTVPLEFIDAPSVDENQLMDKAIISAYAQVGADKMLLLATMAEMDKSIVGLSYIFKKVYKVYRALHKADLKVLRKELKPSELVEIYMNARYNLRPLYYDAKGIRDIILDENVAKRQTFRSSVIEKATSFDVLNPIIHSSVYETFRCDVARSAKVEYTVRAGVLTEAQRANLGQLAGLDSVVESAWDLLPFSFIVDWFVNMGETLSAWTPDLGFRTLTSWVTLNKVTTKMTTVQNPQLSYQNYGTYTHRYAPSYLLTGGQSSSYVREFERIPNYERPLLPSWKIRLSAFKLLDLAIITSKIANLGSLNRRFR